SAQESPLVFYAQNTNTTIMKSFPIKYTITTNNLSEYSDNNFIIQTNTTGQSALNFDPTCTDDYTGSPKFLVGEQQWKVSLNDSELTCYFQNDSSVYQLRNLFVRGDISLDFTSPTGSTNYTQEDTISFLGATTDDCGDALEATVIYNANTTGSGIICDDTTQVGANAFTCDYTTTTATINGWYNNTMFANYSYHYNNNTPKENNPGLFYLNPLRRLSANNIDPSSALYTQENWNFTVNATSGDNTLMRIELFLKKGSGAFTECSQLQECQNQTLTTCTNCQNLQVYWHKNFTQSDAGTWFYQIRMINNNTEAIETQTSGTDSFSVNDIEQETIEFTDNIQTPSPAQWGGTDFNFNVAVNTSSDNNLTVQLWYGSSVSGPWTLLNETKWIIETAGYQNFNTTTKFDCSNIGTNYYFFNASDGAGANNLTTPQTFEVTKDYINLDYISGDGNDANRS
ncbi:MAG: hypothetical protein KAV00_17695, partial [Phycisphaerae bacterium]|nr:hypothetical protein [Phycisphaerae bacterium]